MNNENDSSLQPERQPYVEESLGHLRGKLDYIDSLVGHLEDRITPILRPKTDGSESKSVHESTGVILADDIDNLAFKLGYIGDCLNYILTRIEL